MSRMSPRVKRTIALPATGLLAFFLLLGGALNIFVAPASAYTVQTITGAGAAGNQDEYWEDLLDDQYPGVVCVKFETHAWIGEGDLGNHQLKVHDISGDGHQWVAIVLKYATLNDLFTGIVPGDVLTTSTNQDISHIFKCWQPLVTTTTTQPTTTTTQPTTTTTQPTTTTTQPTTTTTQPTTTTTQPTTTTTQPTTTTTEPTTTTTEPTTTTTEPTTTTGGPTVLPSSTIQDPTTTTDPGDETTTTDPSEVEGTTEVKAETLANTGSDTRPIVVAGLVLLLFGAMLIFRYRTAARS